MWVFYHTLVAVNRGYFPGSGQVQKNGCFVKGVLGKGMHLLVRLKEKKFALCYSLKLENPALLSQNARPAENCSSGTLLLQMHLSQKRETAVSLLRPNNLTSSTNFMDFLRKFTSSLPRCSKFHGKVHLTVWKKHRVN